MKKISLPMYGGLMKKLSITIIGLLPQQAAKIQAAYGGELSLRFIEVGTSMRQVLATASSSDYTILMTKFIPHDIQASLRNREGLTFCNGGITATKRLIEKLFKTDCQF